VNFEHVQHQDTGFEKNLHAKQKTMSQMLLFLSYNKIEKKEAAITAASCVNHFTLIR
jgi:hypothetical protein